ncbi:hypothetical protein [Brevundimonas sp. R86498]|uniref:hypothetical protein n=1 Tax=Brevundimonas sp. R86498 TaxID=3093845 RepID=UPI0037C6A535
MSESIAGTWTGVYVYPDDHPENADGFWQPTPFVAHFTETNGVVGGRISEPDFLWGGPERHAEVDGFRNGDRLVFTKTPADGADLIEYVGTISDERRRIEGQWHIIGSWSGSFRMDRCAPSKPAEERAVQRLPVGAGDQS